MISISATATGLGLCKNIHKSWANITARRAFTVAFGTVDTVRSCDYLGLVSGNDVLDKVAKSGFTASKSEFVNALVMAGSGSSIFGMEFRVIGRSRRRLSRPRLT